LPAVAWAARLGGAAVVLAIAGVGAGIRGDHGRYARAARDQRGDVTRTAATGAVAASSGERWLCVRDAGGFASAAAGEYVTGLRDADGIIVPAALAALSGAAIEADRWAEQGGGAALPQRVGLDEQGATIDPARARCEGALAFAQARVSARGLPADVAASTSAAAGTSTRPAKPARGRAKGPRKPATTKRPGAATGTTRRVR
jgi:hypothetical protein